MTPKDAFELLERVFDFLNEEDFIDMDFMTIDGDEAKITFFDVHEVGFDLESWQKLANALGWNIENVVINTSDGKITLEFKMLEEARS